MHPKVTGLKYSSFSCPPSPDAKYRSLFELHQVHVPSKILCSPHPPICRLLPICCIIRCNLITKGN